MTEPHTSAPPSAQRQPPIHHVTPATPNTALPAVQYYCVKPTEFSTCYQYAEQPVSVAEVYNWISTIHYSHPLANVIHNNVIKQIDVIQQHSYTSSQLEYYDEHGTLPKSVHNGETTSIHVSSAEQYRPATPIRRNEFVQPTTPLKRTSPARSVQASTSTPVRTNRVGRVVQYGKQATTPAALDNEAAQLFDAVVEQQSAAEPQIDTHVVQSMQNALNEHYTDDNQPQQQQQQSQVQNSAAQVLPAAAAMPSPIVPPLISRFSEIQVDVSESQLLQSQQPSQHVTEANNVIDMTINHETEPTADADHVLEHSQSLGIVQQPQQQSAEPPSQPQEHSQPAVQNSDPVCTQHSVSQHSKSQRAERNNAKVTFVESTHTDYHNTLYTYYRQCTVQQGDSLIELQVNDYAEIACDSNTVPVVAHIQQMYVQTNGAKVCYARYVLCMHCNIWPVQVLLQQ